MTAAVNAPLQLAGYSVQSLHAKTLENELADALGSDRQKLVFFANTNFVVKCQPLRESLQHPDVIIVNDGIGVDLAAGLIHRHRFPENLNGTDFTPHFLQHVGSRGKVFLLGGKPGVAARAAQYLHKRHDVNVVGIRDGYQESADTDTVLRHIRDCNANIILVAMGNPAQEAWILNHRDSLPVNVFMGIGALLDFLAGDKPRAPNWIRKMHLEWAYRLMLEPLRLGKRYTLDIGVFFTLCLKNGKSPSK